MKTLYKDIPVLNQLLTALPVQDTHAPLPVCVTVMLLT